MKSLTSRKLAYGIGILDCDYPVFQKIDGKQVICPFYRKWMGILERCFSEKLHLKQPTYKDCDITPDWIYFTKFKYWMESQAWKGLELDKDLLVKGNKIYSPENCLFIPKRLNSSLTDRILNRGEYPLGVSFNKRAKSPNTKCYEASVSNKYIGSFINATDAHKAWQQAKIVELESHLFWYAQQEYFSTSVADAYNKRIWDIRLDHSLGRETLSV